MDGEVIVMFVISGLVIWAALKVLAGLFRIAIETLKKIGAFAVAILPAIVAVYVSMMFMDVTEAQAAAQFVTTDVVVGTIALKMFGV